jgi:hypothetical protein
MSKRMILAVDPGKASGICLFSWDRGEEPELVWAGEYLQHQYAEAIRLAIRSSQSASIKVEVVCERFTINAQTVRNSQAPYSLEQIGILRQCLLDAGYPMDDISFQSPADAKAMFSNEKIRKLEYWHKGGEGHALDAIRHGLLYLVKKGWNPTRLLR